MKIHFIVGIWRSGTSLLREVLGMSKDVQILPEHTVILNHLKLANTFNSSAKELLLKNTLDNPDFIHFANPNKDTLRSGITGSENFRMAIESIYKSCLEEENKKILIDKNPIYSYYLQELMTIFPEAKFIWLIREPKDNCISRGKHGIQSFNNYTYLAQWWNDTNAQIASAKKRFPDRVLMVPYDQMVADPQPWTKNICTFLELDFQEGMLHFETKKNERLEKFKKGAYAKMGDIDPKYAEKKAAMWENLQKPINTSKTRQWERELTSSQIETIDKYTAKYFDSLLKGDSDFRFPKHPIYCNLMKLSLAKLKLDLKNGKT